MSIERAIAVRIPMPDHGVEAHTDEGTRHPFGGQCLTFEYTLESQDALVKTLQQAIEAVRLGPYDRSRH